MKTEWGLPPVREGVPAGSDLVERRRGLQTLADIQVADPSVTVHARTIADVQCIEVASLECRGVMIYAHGGGFRMGNAELWAGFASRLSVVSGLRIILVDYRLAPENPFPNALHDLAAVYRATCADTPSRVFVAGDSAGGGLACSVILNALINDAQSPAGAILFSPWLDLTVSSDSYSNNATTDRSFSREAATEAARQYLQGTSAHDVYASPLFANWKGFPPVIAFVSASEVLADDTIGLVRRMSNAGSRIEAHVVPDMPHVWPMLNPGSPETAAAIEIVGRFVDRVFASSTPTVLNSSRTSATTSKDKVNV